MSFDDFKAALDNASVSGGTVELTGDVTLEESITIPENVAINAGDYNIILPIPTSTDSQLTTVTTVSGDDSLNKVLKSNQVNIGDNSRELLVAYTDDGNSRVYSLSAIVGNNEGGNGIYNIYMGGRDTVIEERTDSELDTDLKLIYTESRVEYTALYNTAQHTNGNDLPARIFGGWEVPSEIPEPYATMLGINNRENISEYKLTLKSGVIESLRGASKEKEGSKVPKVTLNVEGGSADILATGWYYLESVAEYEVNVSGGEVGAIYGNGQTSYTASDNMKDPNFVPTVDNATINISGGDIGFIYGGGRALTQSENSSNKTMVNDSVTINITGGVIDWVNGGGFSGPEAHWGNTSGQDKTIVNDAVINISGGDIYRVFNGGYNGQWNYTYKINADGDLVFSNYNGTDESQTVRNIVNNSTINVSEGADIEELYMGGRSYAYTQNAVVNMTGGRVGNFATSGSYGYTANADANISGGTIDTLELVHRNYVGNIDLDATGGNVANFYAGTGGAYKNSNLNETSYNLSTIAILGNVDINFEDGVLTGGSYLTTGLERADAVTSNVPLTVTYMNLKEDSGYTGSLDYCGQFVVVKDNADWNAIVILTDKDHTSFTTTDEDFACASGVEGMIAVKDEDGAYKLQPASTESSQAAKIGEAYYPTLQAAYNSAIDGSVIELLRNCGEDDAITVAKELTIDLNEYSASISVDDNYIRRTSEDGLFVVVAKNSVADAINVTFEKASEEDDTLYNIVLVASEEKTINRLSTADLTFDLQATAIDYEIIPVAEVNTVNESEDRYLFYFNTNPDPDATGEAITIAQVKFTGYGKLEFGINEDVDTNAAHAATLADSIVTDYIVDGSDLEDETVGDLNINENVTVGKGVIETTINVPKKTLAVNIDFNNSITDNASAYQDMKATISGGDLTTPIVKTFGSEGGDIIALSGNSYSFTEDLTENTAYTVTIEGAGYRTTRYTVTMTGNKTLNFWNNVKDAATVVEVGNDSSMATVNYLAGDIVMNNVIDIYDLSAVVSYFGTINDVTTASDYAKYDLNRDGKIDSKDVAMVLVSWGK